MILQLASASGNAFAYLWADEAPSGWDGAELARRLCPRGEGLGLDGLFILERAVPGAPWRMEHWDADGAYTFCSNGTRAALAVPGAPGAALLDVVSSGEAVQLRRRGEGVGIRMPEGPGFGLSQPPLALEQPAVYGWVGNPQLVLEVPSVAAVDLKDVGPRLRHHAAFPSGTNVNVVEVVGADRARIRSWERGVEGETLCCGTGSAVAGAWLAQRSGIAHWQLQPAGRDPVLVDVEVGSDGAWRELWLSGRLRRLGRVEVDPSLLA